MRAKVKDKDISSEYDVYYEYSEDLRKIPPHRILAINRAEKESVIRAKVTLEIDPIIKYLQTPYPEKQIQNSRKNRI